MGVVEAVLGIGSTRLPPVLGEEVLSGGEADTEDTLVVITGGGGVLGAVRAGRVSEIFSGVARIIGWQ